MIKNNINSSLALVSVLIVPLVLPAESLWRDASVGTRMYADRKANNVGDLVTVIIQESASVSSSKSANTNKSSSVDSGLSKLLYSSSGFLKGDVESCPVSVGLPPILFLELAIFLISSPPRRNFQP